MFGLSGVGKSTLVNSILKGRKSEIIGDGSGTTMTELPQSYLGIDFANMSCNLVDTPGFLDSEVRANDTQLEESIKQHLKDQNLTGRIVLIVFETLAGGRQDLKRTIAQAERLFGPLIRWAMVVALTHVEESAPSQRVRKA
jgi:GTPase Era involved in 16S rRNA processing